MFLAFDIGNTNVKSALFKNDSLIESIIFPDISLVGNYIKSKKIHQAAISSVVPQLTEKVSKILLQESLAPYIITRNSKFNLTFRYNSFETLGVDRICSVEGAFRLYKNSEEFKNFNGRTILVTIDFGTATTINIVRYPGEFIGGIIAPGISMMFDSLKSKTAQLPNVSLNEYKDLIGNDTISSIASGVVNSNLGLLDKAIESLKNNYKADIIKVFVTGGNSEMLLPYLSFEYKYVKDLVLLGVKAVYDKNLGIDILE